MLMKPLKDANVFSVGGPGFIVTWELSSFLWIWNLSWGLMSQGHQSSLVSSTVYRDRLVPSSLFLINLCEWPNSLPSDSPLPRWCCAHSWGSCVHEGSLVARRVCGAAKWHQRNAQLITFCFLYDIFIIFSPTYAFSLHLPLSRTP